MSKRIKNIFKALEYNSLTMLKNIRIRRDSSIILIGAWMGTKFADNSRYLYQFLYENQISLKLSKVIWVTRSKEVLDLLRQLGYEAYLIGSKESNYWHIKAGVHIICNAAYVLPGFLPDIDTKYSFGAKKIQLWHGVGGIKAVGGASNKAQLSIGKRNAIKEILHSRLFNSLFTVGGWGEAHILATGEKCSFCNVLYSQCREDRIFISGYPRNCECIRYLPNETLFIEYIKNFNGCILYLPTFRSDNSHFVHPLSDKRITDFIKDNNLLWIEKPHTADSNNDALYFDSENVYNLKPDFDVNSIYKKMSCIITDYSSVAFDSIYHNVPLAIYAPDIKEFKNGDIGFVLDFESVFNKMISSDTTVLIKLLERIIINPSAYLDFCKNDLSFIMDYAFDSKRKDYKDIWDDICALDK